MKKLFASFVIVFVLTAVRVEKVDAQPARPVSNSLSQTFSCTLPDSNCGDGGPLVDLESVRFWYRQAGGARILLRTVLDVTPGQVLDVVVTFPKEMDNIEAAFEAVDSMGNGSFDCSPIVWGEAFDIRIPPAQCPAPVRAP